MNSAYTEKDTLKDAAVDIPHVTLPSILFLSRRLFRML